MLRRRVMMMGTKSMDDYLTFTALADGTFTLTIPSSVNTTYLTSVAYSIDDGAWVTTDNTSSQVTITTPTVAAGSTVKWKGIGTAYGTSINSSYCSRFSSTGSFSVSGNIMSLLFGDNYKGKVEFSNSYTFCYLFYMSNMTDASNLLLPATTLADSCYRDMFRSCNSLTTAPALPATTLVNNCYWDMFYGCWRLTTAPELPATTLAFSCYYNMFYSCERLTTAPVLPATTLATQCYYQMFYGCTSLTTVPEILATRLDAYNCCYYMFVNCTRLNSVKCLATYISSSSIAYWLYNTASSGTFTKKAGAYWPTGASGIPSGWTVVEV